MNEELPRMSDDDEGKDRISEVPDDISGLIEDIYDRESWRRKAVEKLLENAKNAGSQEERDYWLVKTMDFEDILDEYKSLYPELFSDDNQKDVE